MRRATRLLTIAATILGSATANAQGWDNGWSAGNNAVPYWDNLTVDGLSCNIGDVATGTAGTPGNACLGQQPLGWLPYTGTPVPYNLNQQNTFKTFLPFMFSAGTYTFTQLRGLGGDVTAFDQVWGYFTRTGSTITRVTLPNTESFTQTVTIGSSWGMWVDRTCLFCTDRRYSDTDPLFAVFGSRNTGLTFNSGVATIQAQEGDAFLVGIEDSALILGDYNDIVVSIRAVPEPSTYALMGFGLAGLFAATRRRRRVG